MRHLVKGLLIFVLCGVSVLASWQKLFARGYETHENISSITVLASTSLMRVLTTLVREYSTTSQSTVALVFASPQELANSIQAGEPADIVIMEDTNHLTGIQRQGALDVYSIASLAGNQMALVTSAGHPILKDIGVYNTLQQQLWHLSGRSLLVIPDPASEFLGMQLQNAVLALGKQGKSGNKGVGDWLWQGVEPFIVRAASVGNAEYLIAKGHSAGVVFVSDVHENEELRLVARVPVWLHEPVIYQGAVVAGENMTRARHFLEYLQTPEAQKVFELYGFSPVP